MELNPITIRAEPVFNRFFIEIGSADFDTLIPLAKNGWKGMIVEPVTKLINSVEKVDGVIYENVAVWDKEGTTTIKYFDFEEMPEWAKGVGKINEVGNTLAYNRHPEWNKYIKTQEAPMVRLDDLITKHNISNIDLLKIDIEGGEKTILMDYSFEVAPTVLRIEIEHWPWTQRYGSDSPQGGYPKSWKDFLKHHNDLITKLEGLGYKIFQDGACLTSWDSHIDRMSFNREGEGGFLLGTDLWAIR
jgi:FkbM family methyltransferase